MVLNLDWVQLQDPSFGFTPQHSAFQGSGRSGNWYPSFIFPRSSLPSAHPIQYQCQEVTQTVWKSKDGHFLGFFRLAGIPLLYSYFEGILGKGKNKVR